MFYPFPALARQAYSQPSLLALQWALYGPEWNPSFQQHYELPPTQLSDGKTCIFKLQNWLSKFSTPQRLKFFTQVEGDKYVERRLRMVMTASGLLWEQFPPEPQRNGTKAWETSQLTSIFINARSLGCHIWLNCLGDCIIRAFFFPNNWGYFN